MSQYFSKSYEPFGGDINAKVDLSNYATKTDLKNISYIDVSSYALKSNLANLKTEVDKLDIDKLTPVPDDLAKLSNVVKNDVAKTTEYDNLIAKVDGIDTTNFVSKTKYEKDGSDCEDKINKIDKKIPDVSYLVKKTYFSTKVTVVEGKVPSIAGLATNSELTAVENKIPDVSSLVTKTDYVAEITKIKNDYVTNAALDARHKDLVQKTTFESELKKVDDKASANSSNVLSFEHKLKQSEDTINNLERNASYFRGKSYFGDDGMQNYIAFQPMYKYFKRVIDSTDNTVYVRYWKSKGLSDGKINAPNTSSSNDQAPVLEYGGAGIRLKFKRDLLRQNKETCNHEKIVNIYIVYEISSTFASQSSFTFQHSFFGAVKITKHADISKYRYSGYGIGFDSKGSFLHADETYSVNVIVFGVDLSSSTYANNGANNILVLGKDFFQVMNGTTIYAEKM